MNKLELRNFHVNDLTNDEMINVSGGQPLWKTLGMIGIAILAGILLLTE
jgi:hypothetical protein